MLYIAAFSTPYHFYSARDCLSAGDIALSGRATCSNFAATPMTADSRLLKYVPLQHTFVLTRCFLFDVVESRQTRSKYFNY